MWHFLLFFLDIRIGVRWLHEKLGWDYSILFRFDVAIHDGVDLPSVYFKKVEFLRYLIYLRSKRIASQFIHLACLLPGLSKLDDL